MSRETSWIVFPAAPWKVTTRHFKMQSNTELSVEVNVITLVDVELI